MERRTSTTPVELLFESAYPRQEVRSVAQRLALDVIHRFDLPGPPFDPRMALERMGIPIESRSDLEADAILVGWPEASRILVPTVGAGDTLAGRRLTYSIAHELGHLLLRRELTGAKHVAFEKEDGFEEHFCERFAAEYLMPYFAFTDDVSASGCGADACLRLADRYGVSLTSALRRIATIAGRGKVFSAVMWEREESRFRVAWSTPRYSAATYLDARVDTTVSEAFRTQRVCRGSDQWFDGRRRRTWECSSVYLPMSRKVLTVARQRDCPFGFRAAPTRMPQSARPPVGEVQLSLMEVTPGPSSAGA